MTKKFCDICGKEINEADLKKEWLPEYRTLIIKKTWYDSEHQRWDTEIENFADAHAECTQRLIEEVRRAINNDKAGD